MKTTFRIKRCIDKKIKVGDIVRIVDGSGITHINNIDNEGVEVIIVKGYPVLTGSQLKLMDIDAEVIETGNTDFVCSGVCGKVYLQDALIKIGDGLFRTCSAFLKKVK